MVRRFRGPDQVLVHVGQHPKFFGADTVVPDEVLPLLGEGEALERITYDDAASPVSEAGGNGEGPEGSAGAGPDGGGAGAPEGWAELDGTIAAISDWVNAEPDSVFQRAQFALDKELEAGDKARKTLVAELQQILGIG